MIPSMSSRRVVTVLMLALPGFAAAQGMSPPTPPAAPSPLQDFAWLAGCWEGKVNQRDFREEWLPLRGDIMVGASQTASLGKTQSYEFLRIEPRADGVYYIPMPSGKKETLFRLVNRKTDAEDVIFTFENPAGEFPQRIIYRHGSGGWLYAHVGGMVNGEAKEVIYPMRHVDCQSGELLHK